MADKFAFELSLSILNHLGRNLYRNFITVIGEAVSNSWDAGATNVHIYIDRDNSKFAIKDDGDGMDSNDFQNKFLKVGYSKRKEFGLESASKRPYIGAKGIGKLALLSCAKEITVISKKAGGKYVGGSIDNTGLDAAILDDLKPSEYPLGNPDMGLFELYVAGHDKGTIIVFEEMNEDVKNTVPYLRKLIALYFRFALVDESFRIFVNDTLVTLEDIKDLSDATEFAWNINDLKDPFLATFSKLKDPQIPIQDKLNITGFIATVEKPRYLKIAGTEEKVSIDLFVNGRLRERDILKHTPDFATRFIASYLYGQIHFNELDKDGKDRFTSAREGIVPGDQKYNSLINDLRDGLLETISNKWDELRLAHGEDGDDDNPRKTPKERKARSLFNLSAANYSDAGNPRVNNWLKQLLPEAEFNIPAYVDCFLAENLMRKHITASPQNPLDCLNRDQANQGCEERYNVRAGNTSLCEYCKAKRRITTLQTDKATANTAILIRAEEQNVLMYLDYIDLASIVDSTILKAEEKIYRPIRNSVMHTALLTQDAKTRLRAILDNIIATIKGIVI